ncbi:unnamed protein product [Allacma fusca]|uniref:Uncharacterized protein n=1 Tax=Allacma fusca TaxID=39272 RepID=A0A8J2PD23_9HEXA|nr:unnamed protein product [Allacma fusca]
MKGKRGKRKYRKKLKGKQEKADRETVSSLNEASMEPVIGETPSGGLPYSASTCLTFPPRSFRLLQCQPPYSPPERLLLHTEQTQLLRNDDRTDCSPKVYRQVSNVERDSTGFLFTALGPSKEIFHFLSPVIHLFNTFP